MFESRIIETETLSVDFAQKGARRAGIDKKKNRVTDASLETRKPRLNDNPDSFPFVADYSARKAQWGI